MSILVKSILLLFIVLGLGCVHRPFTTAYMEHHGSSSVSRQKGKAVMKSAIAAHGGLRVWRHLKSYAFEGSETRSPVGLPLAKWTDKFDRKVPKKVFLTRVGSTKGPLLGVDSWRRVFFEMPFVLSNAESITYAGEAQAQGQAFDLVYAEYQIGSGDRGRFIAWVNQSSHLVRFVQFEISSQTDYFRHGTVLYGDYRVVKGVVVPFKIRFLGEALRDHIRSYRWRKVHFDMSLTKAVPWYEKKPSSISIR